MTMIADNDPFAPLLHQFLNMSYQVGDGLPDFGKEPKPTRYLAFQDRHIGAGLQLKCVKRAPWIPKELARISEDAIKQFTAEGHSFTVTEEYRSLWSLANRWGFSNKDSKSVGYHHMNVVAKLCNAYASKLLFNPDDPEWVRFLYHTVAPLLYREFGLEGRTVSIKSEESDSGAKGYDIRPETRKKLADWVIPALDKLGGFESIVNYEYFVKTKEAERLIENMGPRASFKWEISAVIGAPTIPKTSPPLDSPVMKSMFPVLNCASRKPPLRKHTRKPTTISTSRKRKLVVPLEKPQDRDSHYRANADHYIQKAWKNAVYTDTTFFVVHCGLSERIGIRHRESQTLYLSDVIDPAHCKDPGYGKIHLGLALAATKDRLDTADHAGVMSSRPSVSYEESWKEPLGYNDIKAKATRRKRRKLDLEDKKIFDEELAKRDIALFYLNFDIFQSVAPSSFRRMEPSCVSKPFDRQSFHFKRKNVYNPTNYFTMTANDAHIGEGSMGLVYRIVVEIETESGTKLQRNLILKLAISSRKDQILQEYKVYKRLAEVGVTHGIVGVHGLFHDMETDVMIMVMDDAGMSLRTRAIQQSVTLPGEAHDRVETTEEECDAFIDVLEGIHSAEVIHDDLRIDNLLINENGEVFIIDFDIALYGGHWICDEKLKNSDLASLMYAMGWEPFSDCVTEDSEGSGSEGDSEYEL